MSSLEIVIKIKLEDFLLYVNFDIKNTMFYKSNLENCQLYQIID